MENPRVVVLPSGGPQTAARREHRPTLGECIMADPSCLLALHLARGNLPLADCEWHPEQKQQMEGVDVVRVPLPPRSILGT